MPDVTLFIKDVSDADQAAKLERALTRLDFVRLVNVDTEKGLLSVSYEGEDTNLEKIQTTAKEAGHELEPSPGAEHAAD